MTIEIKMPALSPTMEDGTLARWLIGVGDPVASGDIMAEIETDKATMEFEAVDEGTLAQILIEEGTENVAVGTVIALLAEEGEDASAVQTSSAPAVSSVDTPKAKAEEAAPANELQTEKAPSQESAPMSDTVKATPTAKKLAQANNIDLSQLSGTGPAGKITKGDVESAMAGGGAASVTGANSIADADAEPDKSSDKGPAESADDKRIIASPLAKRLAASKGISLADVTGTGPHGRIIKRDIEDYSPGSKPAPAEAASPALASAPAPAPAATSEFGAPFEEEKLSNVRKVIARRLTESKQTVPHYYLTMDIRLDALLDLRKELNAA
ncbi:MAG: E3 binding domain-containing protein, partial [Pseudomonadota bacterium]